MIDVILDPKLVEFGRSHHVSLGGFLRSIRAKIIFETKLKNTKFWEAIRENCLEEAYQWLHEDNQLLKTHISEQPITVAYENIKDCTAFNYRQVIRDMTSLEPEFIPLCNVKD